MRDMLKFVDRKKLIIVFFVSIIKSVAAYALSFCFSYFATSPLTIVKLKGLLTSLIIIYIISLIITWIFIHISQKFLYKIEYDAKNYFYKKLQTLEPQNLTKYHSGYIQSIIERSSQDYAIIIENIIYDFIPLFIGLISFVYMACKQSLLLGLICITIFALAFAIRINMQRARRKTKKAQNTAMSSYNGTLIDFIQNIFTVIKLNAEDFTNKRLVEKENKVLKELQINEDKTANINVLFKFFTSLVYIAVVIFCIFMQNNGQDALPYLIFYISIIGKVSDNLGTCSKKVETIFSFQVNKKQLDDVIGNKEKVNDTNNWDIITILNGKFSYKDRSKIISIPNFKLSKGDKISVMGESGQGKTTILNILSGTYSLNEGEMLFDNIPVKVTRPDVVYISQDVELFDMTIRENLTLGQNISDDTLIQMFNDAGLRDWYNSLENGLDEIVGEKGIRLSAGQRQRLNIIRGILVDKEVYFFDEPTSALDKESEEKIVNMIDKYLKNKTYIIVTHRQSIKRLCNRHYVFKEHTMIEQKI